MSRHSFDPEVAKRVGLNAAVIFQNIVWWCDKNQANGRNVVEGKVWTYNSMKAFETLFPYLSPSQIRTALEKLEETGFIESGNHNETAYDRTKWYCVKTQIHLRKNSNGFVTDRKPIPDSKPVYKPDTPKPPEGDDLFSKNGQNVEKQEKTDAMFDRFWSVYPKKAGKPNAKKAFVKATNRENPQRIIEAAKRYAFWLSSAKPGEFRPTVKHPQGWLNDDRWNDEEIWKSPTFSEDDLTVNQRNLLQAGDVPPSMLVNGQPNDAARYWLREYGYKEAAE